MQVNIFYWKCLTLIDSIYWLAMHLNLTRRVCMTLIFGIFDDRSRVCRLKNLHPAAELCTCKYATTLIHVHMSAYTIDIERSISHVRFWNICGAWRNNTYVINMQDFFCSILAINWYLIFILTINKNILRQQTILKL